MKFRRKTVLIEARRFTGDFDDEMIVSWMGLPATAYTADPPKVAIPIPQGFLDVVPGDWIIKIGAGQFYPCKPEAFAANYEQVEGE